MNIDTDWIENFENIENKYNIFYESKTKTIKVFSLYINPQCILEKIKEESYTLNSESSIKKNEILNLINNYRKHKDITYKLISLISYNILIDPKTIKENNFDEVSKNHMIIHKHLNDIVFKDSIEMFQDLNSIFFVFYELPKKLKTNNTKKVYINTSNKRKTKRNRLKDN